MTHISFRLLACAALLAAPLAFTTPAFAADVDDEIQAAAPPHNAKNYGEFQQLASERMQLVAEHDRMIERCMNVKGQEKTACDKQSDDLNARYENWRQRMEAFHAKSGGKQEMHWDHKKKGGKHWHHKHHMHHADKTGDVPADMKQPGSEPYPHHHHHHHPHDMKAQKAAPAAPEGDTSGQ